MAVGLNRRNPFGAQALFGYDDDYAQKPGPQFPGFGAVPVVGDETQPAVQNAELIEPIAPAEMVGQMEPTAAAEYVTEAQIEARQRLAKALMGNQQEVNHPMQAIGNAVNQIAGAWMEGKAQRDAAENEKRRRDAFKTAVGDGNDMDGMINRLLQSGDPDLVDKGLELRLQSMSQASKRKPFEPKQMIKGDQYVYVDEEGKEIPGFGGARYRDRDGGGGGGGGSGGGIAPTAQGSTFALPDGRIVVAPFVKGRGYVYRGDDGQYRDLPHDARPVTDSAGGPMTAPQFLKLKQDREEGRSALSALDQYIKVVGDLPQGMNRWANDVSAKFKTFLGSKNLTPQEFNQLDAWQKQQALIGLFRTTVVGPGVVTEYDAVRIIQALGGDPSSALQNPQVLERVLNDLYQRKRAEVGILDREYQRNAPYFGEQPEPLGVPDQLQLPGRDRQAGGGAQRPQAPKAGDVVKGYRFKGGNPRNKANWEKVK